AAMAARLHEELITAERAQRDVLAQRADAERRREEADKRLAAAQSARGDAEVIADKLATAEADVRDLVRAQEVSAIAIERERAELLGRREKLARDSEVAAVARNTAADVFATSERGEQVAVDAHNAASKRAEEARLQSATMEERRSASVRVRDALSEQVSATERRIADEEERLRALVAQERDSRGRLETAQQDLGRATADAKEAARSAELARERALAAEGSRRESEQRLAKARERLAELRGERERAMTDLRSLADDLATTIAEQFSATLQAVDREFGIFFQRLFDGGQASLRTSDAGGGAQGAGAPGRGADGEAGEEPGIDIY